MPRRRTYRDLLMHAVSLVLDEGLLSDWLLSQEDDDVTIQVWVERTAA